MKIGNVEIKNRLVMSPMGTNTADLSGVPTDDMIDYYAARAKGGCGLIYTEVCRVNEAHGAAMLRQLSLTRDRNIAGMGKMVAAVHRAGAKMFCQLHHPGNEGFAATCVGGKVVGASDKVNTRYNQPTRALSTEEVRSLIQDFIKAGERAYKAGFDGVELHAAHGYLIGQFFSPYTNNRTDEYGGSLENRCRFAVECIKGIHEVCGEDFPVTIRISCDEHLDRIGETNYIHVKDGVEIAKVMEKAGAAAINVSRGVYESGPTIIENVSYPVGCRTDIIKAVKDAVNIPVIAVNKFRDPDFAEQQLQEGVLDFVAMGRAWLADPDFGIKAAAGRACDIRKCISCCGCFQTMAGRAFAGMPGDCSVNPVVWKERKYSDISYDADHHKVAVIGGGPAGMVAALTAYQRGMNVTLFESTDRLGGQVNYACAAPVKGEMHNIIDWYEKELGKSDVDIRLNTEATVENLKELDPDAIISATGATSVIPKSIPGVDRENVFDIFDVLGGTSGLRNKKVLVVGAGMTGLEAAEYLNEEGCSTTIIEMTDKIAARYEPQYVKDDLDRLSAKGTVIRTKTAIKEILDGRAVITDVDKNEDSEFECDAVVLALGIRSNSMLAELQENFDNVVEVGDAERVDCRIIGATNSAYQAVYHLFEEKQKASYHLPKEEVKKFPPKSVMGRQEGVNFAYLTDPAAVRKILPPQLEPFDMPVVTVSITHINEPTFADDYYETILSVYCKYGEMVGSYLVALLLDGPGSEMAMDTGRLNGNMQKKVGARFFIRKNDNRIRAMVSRHGTTIVDADFELGEYNNSLCHAIYQGPEAGKVVEGDGFYLHFNRMQDKEGVNHFTDGMLTTNHNKYEYKEWKPAFVTAKIESGIDDPWGELPINSIIGGAYTKNNLTSFGGRKLEDVDAEEAAAYKLTGLFDRTMFGEVGKL